MKENFKIFSENFKIFSDERLLEHHVTKKMPHDLITFLLTFAIFASKAASSHAKAVPPLAAFLDSSWAILSLRAAHFSNCIELTAACISFCASAICESMSAPPPATASGGSAVALEGAVGGARPGGTGGPVTLLERGQSKEFSSN